jgi:hypothetical protein
MVAYFDRALAELRSMPTIEVTGLSNVSPMSGSSTIAGPVQLESGETPGVAVQYRVADGGFFATLGIRLVRGRLFR